MRRQVVLLGSASGVEPLRAAGFEVQCNLAPGEKDIVLVSVTVDEGFIRSTMDAIDLVAGHLVGHFGVLLTGTQACEDPDLPELVGMAVQELLVAKDVVPFGFGELPVFRADDPRVGHLLADYGASPPHPFVLRKTDRSPD